MSTSEVYEPYLLRASNGERRDAFQAGNIPAAMLKTTERIHTLRISWGIKIGVTSYSS